MPVYNHEKYLKKAIDSVIGQDTTFPFEIIIHDDASTDNSAQIIRRYASRYPDRIVPVIQTKNQYSMNINIFINYELPKVRGKYIAFCEGDDYWTDKKKLQTQVEYLEMADNSDCAALYHNCKIVNELDQEICDKVNIYRTLPECDYSIYQFATSDTYPGQLASLMLRSSIFDIDESVMEAFGNLRVIGGDFKLLLLALCSGRVHVIKRNMSAHRVSYNNGSYTARTSYRNMSGHSFVAQIDSKKFARRYFKIHLYNNYKIFHSGCAVAIKRIVEPNRENASAFRYAVSSAGGFIAFCAYVLWNGFVGVPIKLFGRLYNI